MRLYEAGFIAAEYRKAVEQHGEGTEEAAEQLLRRTCERFDVPVWLALNWFDELAEDPRVAGPVGVADRS